MGIDGPGVLEDIDVGLRRIELGGIERRVKCVDGAAAMCSGNRLTTEGDD
jgi:hypothetical protein